MEIKKMKSKNPQQSLLNFDAYIKVMEHDVT